MNNIEVIFCRVQMVFSVIILIGTVFMFINAIVKGSPLFIIVCFAAMLYVAYTMLFRTSLDELREAKRKNNSTND